MPCMNTRTSIIACIIHHHIKRPYLAQEFRRKLGLGPSPRPRRGHPDDSDDDPDRLPL